VLFVSFGALLLYLVYINQRNLHLANCIAENGVDANCDYLEESPEVESLQEWQPYQGMRI